MDNIDFLKTTSLFQGFTDSEIRSILPLLRLHLYEQGTLIIQEGEPGDSFYLIKQGSVEVLQQKNRGDEHYPLERLEKGEWFGELAFLGEGIRESTVRALDHAEIIEIPISEFFAQGEENPVAFKMAINWARKLGQRLKQANQERVRSMKKQFDLMRTHDHMGRLLVYVFIIMTLFFYLVKIRVEAHPIPLLAHLLDSFLIIGVGLCGWFFVKQSHYPLEFYGVTCRNGWRYLKEGVLWTLPVLLGMLILKWVLITFIPDFKSLPLISISQKEGFFDSIFDPSKAKTVTERTWIFISIYILLVPLQEFIARGCLQGFLTRFFLSSHRVFLAIVTSNLLFGLFHGFRSIAFSLVAAILGCFWGWIYHKQGSLVGAIVSHALVGVWGLGLLNYQNILI